MVHLVLFFSVILPRFKIPPKTDGIVSENEWENATKFEDFTEFQPEEGKEPLYKTYLFIGYDENNLYIAFKCFDDVSSLRKTYSKRDELFGNDCVLIYLDTYGDLKNAYIFGTNPLGVPYDGILKSNGEEDYSFDTDFEVKSKIFEDYWSCEFKIPFSSLRFKENEKQEWRVIFLRIRLRGTKEIYTWPPLSRGNPFILDQSGYLIIPEKIKVKKKNFEFIPYFISFQKGERENFYRNKKVNFKTGITGKYLISSNLVLDFALNPDYAQIETDAPQIDVNTTFALFYPEKRPFFMEGKGIYETPISDLRFID